MKENIEHIDILIAKTLAKEANADELLQLESWIKASEHNKAYYDDMITLLTNIDHIKSSVDVDVNAAWNKLEQRIESNPTKVISIFQASTVWKIAASILLILTIGLITKFALGKDEIKPDVFVASNKPIEKALPDGSKVFINRNSEISYVVNSNNEREVKLKGEAFFKVVHDEKQPFIIAIDDVKIKDIGTEFNVKALPGNDVVEVLVEEGEVQFYTENSEGLVLVKGEKATYSKLNKKFAKQAVNTNENTLSYYSKVFYFKETTLKEIINQINQVYASNIQLGNSKLENCKLSVTFNNEKIEVIISIIAETLNLNVERKGDAYILKGENCREE